MKKNIIISGGGTGGHVYPGICLAKELLKAGHNVIFVVKKNDYCIPLLKREQIAFTQLDIMGFPRRVSFLYIYFFYKLFRSVFDTAGIFVNARPDAAFGLGGFISFPVILAAAIFRVPTVIHEQNYIPGLANRVLGLFADRIAVNFESTRQYFNETRVVISGNPVRPELFGLDRNTARHKMGLDQGKFTILVFGGSMGAHSLNTFMVSLMEYLLRSGPDYARKSMQFIHITGQDDFLDILEKYRQNSVKSLVVPYLHEIGYAYASSDIVISRAGATTVSELYALAKPAILIPYPRATGAHQDYNAKYLVDAGLAHVIKEKDLDAARVGAVIMDLIKHPELLEKMKASVGKKPVVDSSKILAETVLHLIKN